MSFDAAWKTKAAAIRLVSSATLGPMAASVPRSSVGLRRLFLLQEFQPSPVHLPKPGRFRQMLSYHLQPRSTTLTSTPTSLYPLQRRCQHLKRHFHHHLRFPTTVRKIPTFALMRHPTYLSRLEAYSAPFPQITTLRRQQPHSLRRCALERPRLPVTNNRNRPAHPVVSVTAILSLSCHTVRRRQNGKEKEGETLMLSL